VLGGPLTVEAVFFGASTGVGIAAAVLAAAPLSLVLSRTRWSTHCRARWPAHGAAIGTRST